MGRWGVVVRGLLVAGVVAGGVLVVLTATVLPDRVPTHSTLTGRPDGWSSRSGAAVFALCFWLGFDAVLTGLAAAARWLPLRVVDVPDAAFWTAPENVPELRRRLGALLLGVAAVGSWIVVAVLGGLVAAGLDPAGRSPWWSTAGSLLLTAALVGVASVGARRAVRPPTADRPAPRP